MPYLPCNGIDLYYEQLGIGSPVLFLHSGFSRGLLAFASQILDFQTSYACYYPDFRGHGRTRSDSLEWSTPQHAEDMIAFLDQLDIPNVHLIGYGMGGGVALYCALNHPERIASLTSIGQCGFVASAGSEEFEPERLLQTNNAAFIQSMEERHRDAHRGDWQTFLRTKLKDWRSYPQLTDDQLRAIRCPSLFIAGELDELAPEADMKRVTALIPDSRYVVVPGGSHRPHMNREQPVFVNDTILQFIADHS
ncbi:alpha/beta hydrolase [Paenibacillus rhizovicinus]|uniref:Alpha/beta hydrolase n=1 Tax=Paenibacillus rhizovicinus TaxID=2704463 RepID=A0A6C0NV83_9BACL|nr:alpha/beta hydrolase [Paenibacillus rhizovicinus]QHW29836.1 alpha/beta hydrolase [Paenibacillus rhizovicinus]